MGDFEIALAHSQEAHALAEKLGLNKPRSDSRGLTVRDPAYWLGLGGSRVSSGVSVTPDSAMRTSAVWACIRVLSTSLATLPLHTLRDLPGGGHELAKNDPVYDLLHRAPNPEITSFTFRQLGMVNVCAHGNAYSEIEFDNFGGTRALWPIPSWCCEPMRSPAGELYYRVVIPTTGEIKNLQPYRMVHVMGMGTDGMKGLSPIRQHAETIGITIAAERFSALFFSNGMNVGGVAEHPGTLTNEGSEHLRKSLNEKYAGLGNSHRLILLEEGMKYQKVGINPEEAQLLEERQYQVEDIARIYGIQLHKIGHLLHATFSNIEHQAIEFVTDTMLPHAVNWEMEYDRKLCSPGLYTKHSMEGLLRGDQAARATFYKELFNLGALCPDEIRDREDLNPIPDGLGKRYYVMANMIPADKVDQYLDKQKTSTSPARSLTETVKKIEERDKANILAAYQRDPDGFTKWLEDYKRDFPEYVEKQLTK